jgi:pheromone shutdown protein TraB
VPNVEDSESPIAPAPGPLTLIGTGHVLDIASKITNAIQAMRPDVVFVELDIGRLRALQARRAGNSPPLQGGWLQNKLHAFQEEIANEYGVQAGDEMLAAVDAAMQIGARVELIDRPIQQTLQRATKQITLKERLRLAGTVISGTIKSAFQKRSTKELVEKELDDYNADPASTLASLKRQFPTIYRVLIEERDEWMAKRIRNGLQDGRRGVAVVGDGHVDGMIHHLSGIDVTPYRLPDVRAGLLPVPDLEDTSSVTIGFDFEA